MEKSFSWATLALTIAILVSGCASTVKVESNPPGALVRMRGSGRAIYRWKTAGLTPCEFKAPYSAIQTYVRWEDGTESEKIRVEIPKFSDPDPIRFTKPTAP